MAVNKVPVLKRCRSLGLEPSYLGYDKKSNRELKRANKKMSEYGLHLPSAFCSPCFLFLTVDTAFIFHLIYFLFAIRRNTNSS